VREAHFSRAFAAERCSLLRLVERSYIILCEFVKHRTLARSIRNPIFAIGLVSGCAGVGWKSTGPECAPPPLVPLVPFSPARAEALIGEYDFVFVADVGPRAGHSAHGRIHLTATDTLRRYYINPFGQGWLRRGDRPLMGWAELRGDVGLATAGAPLTSRDPAAPGVVSVLDSLVRGLTFMLGYRLMLDGGGNELTVTRAEGNRFEGRWESGIGPTTYRAAGFFCAQRRSPDR